MKLYYKDFIGSVEYKDGFFGKVLSYTGKSKKTFPTGIYFGKDIMELANNFHKLIDEWIQL